MWSGPARRAFKNGGVAFAECKQVCAPINQELDHLCVALYAGHVQWCVAKIAGLNLTDSSVNPAGHSPTSPKPRSWSLCRLLPAPAAF